MNTNTPGRLAYKNLEKVGFLWPAQLSGHQFFEVVVFTLQEDDSTYSIYVQEVDAWADHGMPFKQDGFIRIEDIWERVYLINPNHVEGFRITVIEFPEDVEASLSYPVQDIPVTQE